MEPDEQEYDLIMSFWMDTDAYTDRDREMFVAGVEFEMVRNLIVANGWTGTRPIRPENESRIRMMCGKLGVQCEISPCEGYEDWSELTVLTKIKGINEL